MRLLKLFLLTCGLSGLAAALGSIVGHAFGETGLWVGGVVGGLAGASAAARLARGRGWIAAPALPATMIGACLGFGAAAYLAVNNLSSPVVPILSTSLSGLGALLGQRLGGGRVAAGVDRAA